MNIFLSQCDWSTTAKMDVFESALLMPNNFVERALSPNPFRGKHRDIDSTELYDVEAIAGIVSNTERIAAYFLWQTRSSLPTKETSHMYEDGLVQIHTLLKLRDDFVETHYLWENEPSVYMGSWPGYADFRFDEKAFRKVASGVITKMILSIRLHRVHAVRSTEVCPHNLYEVGLICAGIADISYNGDVYDGMIPAAGNSGLEELLMSKIDYRHIPYIECVSLLFGSVFRNQSASKFCDVVYDMKMLHTDYLGRHLDKTDKSFTGGTPLTTSYRAVWNKFSEHQVFSDDVVNDLKVISAEAMHVNCAEAAAGWMMMVDDMEVKFEGMTKYDIQHMENSQEMAKTFVAIHLFRIESPEYVVDIYERPKTRKGSIHLCYKLLADHLVIDTEEPLKRNALALSQCIIIQLKAAKELDSQPPEVRSQMYRNFI